MVAEKGASRKEGDGFDMSQPDDVIERGYYGRALREGRVRSSPPGRSRRVDTLLWVLNAVLWLMLGGFVAWRLLAIYLTGGA